MICIPESDPGLFLATGTFPRRPRGCATTAGSSPATTRATTPTATCGSSGRKDDIIKSFGYRVSPYEVERVLKSHPAVADCACVGEEAGKDKLLVVAYVIAHAGHEVSPDELAAFGREHLASYKAPKVVYLAKEFPRTRNGKILRREIRPDLAVSRSAR